MRKEVKAEAQSLAGRILEEEDKDDEILSKSLKDALRILRDED